MRHRPERRPAIPAAAPAGNGRPAPPCLPSCKPPPPTMSLPPAFRVDTIRPWNGEKGVRRGKNAGAPSGGCLSFAGNPLYFMKLYA